MGSYSKIKDFITGYKAERDALRAETESLARRISVLKAQGDSITKDLVKVTKDNKNLIKQRDSVKQGLSRAREVIKNHDNEITGKDESIKSLSTQLDELAKLIDEPTPTDPPKPKSKNVSLDPPNRQAKKKK